MAHKWISAPGKSVPVILVYFCNAVVNDCVHLQDSQLMTNGVYMIERKLIQIKYAVFGYHPAQIFGVYGFFIMSCRLE